MDQTSAKSTVTGPIDCACVIHGDAYSWQYVERLYNMLNRHISLGIRFHVYTEASRPVPDHMIKHALDDWGVSGPKRGWWYKMQLFNPRHHSGPLLYFDLDTVIVDNIDWICYLPSQYFWAIHDFKHLWRPTHQGINSSVMWWDTKNFEHVWREFEQSGIQLNLQKYRGDQDFIGFAVAEQQRRYLDSRRIKSWRWQCLDGGYDFYQKRHVSPDSGTHITPETSVLVFHGQPKPDQIQDTVVLEHWR